MTSRPARIEDSDLIKLALAGEQQSFSTLMDRHLNAVRARLRMMVSGAADVEDLVQEITLNVWRRLSQFRAESTFRSWLIRIAINQALIMYRRRRCRPVFQALDEIHPCACTRETPHQALVREEEREAIHHAIAALPAMYQEVVILRDIEELSTREAAKRLNTTSPAVKTRLFRAHLMLLALFNQSRRSKVKLQDLGRRAARGCRVSRGM